MSPEQIGQSTGLCVAPALFFDICQLESGSGNVGVAKADFTAEQIISQLAPRICQKYLNMGKQTMIQMHCEPRQNIVENAELACLKDIEETGNKHPDLNQKIREIHRIFFAPEQRIIDTDIHGIDLASIENFLAFIESIHNF
ncbi:unnamed protein product [Didymodactylos carnosus]|uniref:Uncharacterized protein n=1 Tax=Didymodactylos carnosus TaxID=1234261 RepID=A0A813ZX52_9BILA|nr:unnamed protein product [Didymodactylos carnosus]CAF0920094.1 unnamed protein product [Didymodactylos carnosus]CAF3687576.1 unnamed protein product [Didymodactylos carnosus]CAF3697678.1 unnamed protein product [Didymodactylos carnosus]